MARNNIIGSIRNLASYGREHIPQINGVSILGKGLHELHRIPNSYGTLRRSSAADNTPTRNSFGRFSSPNEGNIAQSGSENITASAERMTSPSARDSDTIKRWRRI